MSHFIRQQDTGHRGAVGQLNFVVEVSLPFGHRLEGGGPRDVKHDKRPDGLLVVDPGHVAKPFLAWGGEDWVRLIDWFIDWLVH